VSAGALWHLDGLLSLLFLAAKAASVYFVAADLRQRLDFGRSGSTIAAWALITAALTAVYLILSAVQQLATVPFWVSVIALGAAYGLWRRRRPALPPADPSHQWTWPERALLVAAAGLVALVTARNTLLTDLTWDAQTYELPRLALWMHYRSVFLRMDTAQVSTFTNEWLGEFISLGYTVAGGTLRPALLGGVEILGALFVAVYWFARVLGAKVVPALVIALLLGGTPTVLALASVVKGDLLAVVGLLMATGFAVLVGRSERPAVVAAMAVLGTTLAAGAKISVLPAAGLIGLWVVWTYFRRRTSDRLAFIGLSVVGGIFLSRYLANLAMFGNPLIRSPNEAASSQISLGKLAANLAQAGVRVFAPEWWGGEVFVLVQGFGLSGLALVGFCLVFRPRWQRVPAILLAIVVLGLVVSMSVTWAYPWSFRYFLPNVAVIAVIVAAQSAGEFRRAWLSTPVAIACCAIVPVNLAFLRNPGEFVGYWPLPETAERAWQQTPQQFVSHRLDHPDVVSAFRLDTPRGIRIAVLSQLDMDGIIFAGSSLQNRVQYVGDVPALEAAATAGDADVLVVTKTGGFQVPPVLAALKTAGYDLQWEGPLYFMLGHSATPAAGKP